jgi:glyoxylase-like metal-dependent hydrolase (beta-lactamase superfamily II)
MFERQSIQVVMQGKAVTVHLVSTAMVAVKRRFREMRFNGSLSTIDFVLDDHFTEWLPIWVMVIEHPEGTILIDTGEIAEVMEPGYFRSSGFFTSWFDKSQFKFKVEKEDEVISQLQALNISVESVKKVVLTHLHFDHTDGLKYFPHAEIMVNKAEWEQPFGDLPKLYPSWFSPKLIELDQQYDVFERCAYLTDSKDLLLVHTPGHTWGHCSVLLKTDTNYILFAADICYSQEQLLENKFAANSASHELAKKTYAAVKSFAASHSTVFLPSHDPESGIRLKKGLFLTI